MNVFVLHLDPYLCATYHADKHVSKMLVEYAQLMSTAHRELDGDEYADKHGLYKSTHRNHPCAIWVRESVDNYKWLYQMWEYLHEEFHRRRGKTHKSFDKLSAPLWMPPNGCPRVPMTPFALCMPDEYKVIGDVVESYRNYYRYGKDGVVYWRWLNNRPEWMEIAA